MSLRAETISSACARPSSAQGPATSTSGRLLPKRAAPTATVALGAASTFMAGDHAPALFRGQRPAQRAQFRREMLRPVGLNQSLDSRLRREILVARRV